MVEYLLSILLALVASFVSGTIGFGGALLLLPALTALLGLQKALPLLAVAQLTGNLSRAAFGFSLVDWKIVCFFLCGALPLSILATLGIMQFSLPLAYQVVGIVSSLVALFEIATAFSLLPRNWLRSSQAAKPGYWLSFVGACVGTLSGVAGTAGPLSNAVFLRLNLKPTAYVATDAVAMAAIHLSKTAVFGSNTAWALPETPLVASACLAMIVGTWLGHRVLACVSNLAYHRLVAVCMLIAAAAVFFMPPK